MPKRAQRRNPTYYLNIRSRHTTHDQIRNKIRLPFRTIVRLGSRTDLTDFPRIECNSVKSVITASNKFLMKQAFDEHNIITPNWIKVSDMVGYIYNACILDDYELKLPIVLKYNFGSRNRGNTLLSNADEYKIAIENLEYNINNYILEEYVNYVREYRLHVTEEGCFYTCRKMLKSDTLPENRWFRNDSNCVWFIEDNPTFNKPECWDELELQCVEALKAVKLDVGACDVRVNKDGTKFSIIEINSAPSFGEGTAIKYLEMLPKLLTNKYNDREY